MKQFMALVDCNNFYASVERLFAVALRNRPVLVLSNNDGCVVARSTEVKRLNIKMGTPLFKIRHLVEQHNIQIFSSNHALYQEVSNRVMHALSDFSPLVEIYSIVTGRMKRGSQESTQRCAGSSRYTLRTL